MNISIPVPCHEDWNQMKPEDKGRLCNACCKTVVDFSEMTPDAVSAYLLQHPFQKICGRFKNEQLEKPDQNNYDLVKAVWVSSITLVKKLAAVFLILFSMSKNINAQTSKNNEGPHSDSLYKKGKVVLNLCQKDHSSLACDSAASVKTNSQSNKKAPDQLPTSLPVVNSKETIYFMGLVAPKTRSNKKTN